MRTVGPLSVTWHRSPSSACAALSLSLSNAMVGLQATSRLACQIKLTKELDGLVVGIPDGAHNYMDHIPFDDRSAR